MKTRPTVACAAPSRAVEAATRGLDAILLTRPQLAMRWQCSVGHLANLASADKGPSFLKLGSSVRYRLADIEAYEKALEVQTLEASVIGLSA